MDGNTATPLRRNARTQVLEAALALFTDHGYFTTSVHDIAAAAGVSIGSIYHHFGDKEGIARTLYGDLLQRMEAAMDGIAAAHRGTAERCRAVTELLFRLTEEEPQVMAFMLSSRHREFLPQEPPVCSSRPFALMRGMVAEGMERGEVRALDPLVAATAVFGPALRLIQLRLDGLVTGPLTGYLDEVWDCAWRSVAR